MKRFILIILCCLIHVSLVAQEEPRIEIIKNQLTALAPDNVGLTENVKTDISVSSVSLSTFLLAIAEIHKLNFNVSSELNKVSIATNFPNVTVGDLLIFLCKEYDLTIEFTGNILSVKKYTKPIEKIEVKEIPIEFNLKTERISLDIKNDTLYTAFKRIMDKTGKNLVFSPGLENRMLTFYIKDASFDDAMEKLAFANTLYMEKTSNGFYMFEDDAQSTTNAANGQTATVNQRPVRRRKANFNFKILDAKRKIIEVDFVNTPIDAVVHDIANALGVDIFTAAPLTNAGVASVKSKRIAFDDLLTTMFESSQNQITPANTGNARSSSGNTRTNTNQNQVTNDAFFTFKKDRNVYIFGTANQLSLREISIIPLMHRSIELLTDSNGGSSTRARSSNVGQNSGFGSGNQFDSFSGGGSSGRRTLSATGQSTQGNGLGNTNSTKAQALINILPADLISDLQIEADYELNSFYVSGPSSSVVRFRNFIEKIDKPVPVILIEVMLIDVSKLSEVKTGISWGIGDQPTQTSGSIFPTTELTLGANTVNRVIGGFAGFGSFNLGKVVPEFFANISAMERDGDIKIRSTPKISTLNGHRATLSNGTTSYYAVTQRNIYGTDNPQTSEITNYYPIDAELGISIKPIVSGDGQVTLDIFVIQSSFGTRIDDNAPPDIKSREFRSIIRMRDQDIAVLGGIEAKEKIDEGDGVPFLARIPVIKWFFSQRTRKDSKSKLTVLIKPTVIY